MKKEDGKLLLELARKILELHFYRKKFDESKYDKFSEKQGVFVTLHKHGELRGCIGFPHPVYPLKDAVQKAALSAAFDDPRFPALREEELKEIDIEISVLTVPEKIEVKKPEEYFNKIKIGKDGLILRSPLSSGLLLPQVFTEWKVDAHGAVEMTCEKAGLPRDAWKHKEVEIFKFQAEIFSESKKKDE